MKALVLMALILACGTVQARTHVSVQIGLPGVAVGYSNGYGHGYYRGNRVAVVVAPVVYQPTYYYQPYVVREVRPVVYNRYPSGYNYTGSPTYREYP